MGRRLADTSFAAIPFGGDEWRLTAEGDALRLPHVAAVFAIGDGLVGVRGPGDHAGGPRVYLNGVYEILPIQYHEAAFGYARESDTRLAVADATSPELTIDGQPVDTIVAVELDLARGVRTERRQARGAIVTIEQFAAMARPGLVVTRVSYPAGLALDVAAAIGAPPADEAGEPDGGLYDPRVAPTLGKSPWQAGDVLEGVGHSTRLDRLPASDFHVSAEVRVIRRATEGGRAIVDLASAYAASREEQLAGKSAAVATAAMIAAAGAAGFDALLDEQTAWFADHWAKSDVAITGAPGATRAMRHALAELAMAVGRDGQRSIGAKGQTGEGYEGHVFWDADLYVLPVFAFTRPEIARAMLSWRIGELDAARDNARAMGQQRGALYPWRTIGGHECSSYFPAGPAQYHINADIAFALDTYVAATGDRSILADGGAAMLVETARIWLEIGFHDPARDGAFVINRVTGPDEYSALVDNNLYTNLMAARHLRLAAREGVEAGLLDAAEAARMTAAADAMFLPVDDERGLYAQDDAFFAKQPWPFDDTPADSYPLLLHFHPLAIYRHRVAKQADAVLALALMPEAFEPDMRRRMIAEYERWTVHDSTLSASAFATAAARAGDGARAARYWQVAALTDLADLFGNTDHGLHMAALAGGWSAMAMGFAGMRVEDETLAFDPIAVPGLDGYDFTVTFRGTRIHVAITATEARFTWREGEPVRLRCGASETTLAGTPIVVAIA